MAPSWFQILLVVVLAVLLFGRGKISQLMGDVAKGINAFKKGMKDGVEEDSNTAQKSINDGAQTIDAAARETKAEHGKG